MNIGRQWEDRLRIWSEQFPKHYFRKTASVSLSYFTTMDRLTLVQAMENSFSPAPRGLAWGKKWEYGWFRTSITIPEELDGQRVVFTLGAGDEMLVWVNGQEAGAIDKRHKWITLSRQARSGDAYEIVAECYAGHGVRNEGAGPVGIHEQPVPEPPQAQVSISESCFGVWNEPLFQAAMDYLTLYSLVKKLPEKSLRAMKIIEALKKFTCIADFELPEPALTESVVEADKLLKPILSCKNGSTAPEFTIFGQSHLDLAWLWPVEETLRKSARTYSNQLALMDEYEEYRFLLCEPPILEWLKELYPNTYARVREKTASGAFLPDGALWVESDTNIPSGESLIRQFVRGKRWFRQELGVESKMAWMPDTFGFSAALPQIMAKCGVPYFATQKLLRQDPEAQPFPYNLFWWEGLDGSRVKAHIFKKNNAVFDSGDLITRWESDRIQQENIDGMLYPFGYGDGGGGPTREMLEIARRCADLEGAPRCRMESPERFFERQQDIPQVFTGELYLAWHRGTLTSQAKTKQGIRKAEITLKMAEYHLSRQLLAGRTISHAHKDLLEELWKKLLFNQFHDIAPGTSIARVHQEAEAQLQDVICRGNQLLEELLGKPTDTATVYNHLSFPRYYRGKTVPAQGSIRVSANEKEPASAVVTFVDGCYELRNQHLICRIDGKGQLVSVQIPGSNREFLRGAGNRLLMYKDVNTCYDAWELGSMYENLPVVLTEEVQISICREEEGAALLVRRKLHDSLLTQKILLRHHSKRLDFITDIHWQERHKLLKVAFPVNIHTTVAVHEIQFGQIHRPTHRSRQSEKDMYEVCNHRYTALQDGGAGAAVLNDCKYGVSAHGSEIRLTLLKSPLMPDMHADQGHQHFTYSFCPFLGALSSSDVLREAADLNEPMLAGSAQAEDGIGIFVPRDRNIIVDTIKPADTRENTLLVRAYEAMGMETEASFTPAHGIAAVWETDMLEENPRMVSPEKVTFGPFEIKTFLLQLTEQGEKNESTL